MNHLFKAFAACPLLVIGSVQATICDGPNLHHLRMVGRYMLEVQGGHGRVARTSDWGQTWQMVDKPSDEARAFEGRLFYGSEGEQLQNLTVGDSGMVVIERTADRVDWQVRNSGLLLAVRGNSAFVYRGALGVPSWPQSKGQLLIDGTLEEEAINRDLELAKGWHPAFKLEFRPGSVCIWTENAWRTQARCEPGLPWREPFELTGIAVQDAQLTNMDDVQYDVPARDVYLSTSEVIMRWQGATGTWGEVPYPREWRQCNGPVPQQFVPAPLKPSPKKAEAAAGK
jgi:hypothetical protein